MSKRKWQDFPIGGENGVFSIKSSVSQIDKKDLNTISGSIPYITRTNLNNGVSMYVTKDQNKKYTTNKGNVITIGLDTQTIFYQPNEFYTGQNIQILSSKNMNINVARFLIPLLEIQVKKFSWGGNGATLKRLNNLRIMLPINDDEKIDWQFMENIGKKLYQNQRENIKKYLMDKKIRLEQSSITLDKKADKEVVEWKTFKLDEIFSFMQRGKRLTKANQIGGNIPYISSTSLNNGIDNFIGNTTDIRQSEYNLTIANSGSVGSTFYHDYPYIASDHVHSLTNKKFNKYHYLFISVLLNRLKEKYHFNREINNLRLKNENIILPTNEEGKINLIYMENYMKRIEYNQLSKLIKYLN